ncbi:hypothetical protein AMES_2580 [Amycolatopsis mediterranei S699]|uniref:DUF3710 domain-containing protein n=2 Tax=Amycolatopsis mediterranei TaxID=33910 RepID=A0A0H3D4I4_AMYMU|nr:DUF3710 domain-containing protein [Amycolatopsis mediterranei]ADJ44403.1 conserved hypothetical protein [Amycolatopsis mediterranei U32]AEK41140.1 hypothetical protein RAM_13250 [Amycolatopsis mediterranei S699]AFO76116.1 hypothetical protein AMES_2580 [Amycolatopsis mediterranei S699]AGT83245.1 hypothetical protein B737_2581 [Amycolatopsis mediterranei RB]KDO06680.1 hypothetical protein DV26_31280 [Amycolatopsis mediterranei]
MGIFGRKRRTEGGSAGRHAAPEADDTFEDEEHDEDGPELSDVSDGPFDVTDFDDDGIPRIDLGSVKVPVPDGSQVQVEMDPEAGGVRAVHVVTEQGQITVSAYAAPRSGGLWREVSSELADQLRADGAKVTIGRGVWGLEISAIIGDVALRFVGVDRPRWMLRGVIAGPQSEAAGAVEVLREIVRRTIVDRGDAPMPVRTPLTITLPEAVAEHIAAQQQQG